MEGMVYGLIVDVGGVIVGVVLDALRRTRCRNGFFC